MGLILLSSHVFDHPCSNSDAEQDDGPSTVDLLRTKRAARQRAAQVQQATETDRLSVVSLSHASYLFLNLDCLRFFTRSDHPRLSQMQAPASTSQHTYRPESPRGSQHQTRAYWPNNENAMNIHSGQEYRQYGRPHQSPASPLRPHNNVLPGHGNSLLGGNRQYYDDQQSGPQYSPRRNRERSRSPVPRHRIPLSPLPWDIGHWDCWWVPYFAIHVILVGTHVNYVVTSKWPWLTDGTTCSTIGHAVF